MSNTIEDKISLFTKVIMERIEFDFQKKQKKLIEHHENRLKAITDEHEEKRKIAIEKVVKEAQSRKQRIILKTKSELRLLVLKRRQEFKERVSDEVKKKVRAFINTDEYADFLEEAIEKVLLRFPKEQFAYFSFSSNDIKNRTEIILNTINSLRDKDSYQIDTADNLIGGVFVKSGDGRLEIDFTINTILEDSDKLIGEVLSSWLGKEN
jgi:V/A-type H+-transporting ATPase subunit E